MESTNTFRQRVYMLASKIPRGKVATYGQLAIMAGSPGAARAVGLFMKENPDLKTVPCHRVVAADGKLTGYSNGGISVKKQMLIDEGVDFKNDSVDLSTARWRP